MNESAATIRNPSAWHAAWYLCIAFIAPLCTAQYAASQPHRKNPRGSAPHKASPQSRTIASHQADSTAPPAPAEIVLRNGLLSINANNSDLEQILRSVAQASGMLISGSAESTRVFGVYGPQDPANVLTELLSGTGFNIMMVGRTQMGTPRELLLTPKRGAPSPPAVTPGIVTTAEPDRGVTNRSITPVPSSLGPGALPSGPPPPPQDPEERSQRNLRRLQQMQDRQKTRNPPR